MKKIYVFCNEFWNTGKGMTGGDKRTLEFLRRWQNERNVKIIVFAPKKFINIMNEENIAGYDCVVTSTKKSEGYYIAFSYIIHMLHSITLLPHGEKDCIFYATSGMLPDTVPCILGKWLNKKSVFYTMLHHMVEKPSLRPGNKIRNTIAYIADCMSRGLMKLFADKIMLVNPLIYDYLKDHHYGEQRLAMVSNGVDMDVISSLTAYEDSALHYDASFLARLAPSKGIFELPIIWKKVVEKIPEARLIIIGGGPAETIAQMNELVKKNGLQNNITITGYLDTDSAYKYLKSSKLFLFTSHEEGWGISNAEAMACGLPVVAYTLPVYKYVFTKGMIECELGNKDIIASEVINLLRDNTRRNQLSKEAYDLVSTNYTWDQVAELELKTLLS